MFSDHEIVEKYTCGKLKKKASEKKLSPIQIEVIQHSKIKTNIFTAYQ